MYILTTDAVQYPVKFSKSPDNDYAAKVKVAIPFAALNDNKIFTGTKTFTIQLRHTDAQQEKVIFQRQQADLEIVAKGEYVS